MDAEIARHVMVVGLEVTDPASYARYRARMTPILESYGGEFSYDFVVAEVLRAPCGERFNRVFALTFPDRAQRERFFADEAYRGVRAELFEPAVARAVVIAET